VRLGTARETRADETGRETNGQSVRQGRCHGATDKAEPNRIRAPDLLSVNCKASRTHQEIVEHQVQGGDNEQDIGWDVHEALSLEISADEPKSLDQVRTF